ncbi:DEAD/DEAH box helicase [Microbacterium sp. NPDC055357]
MPKNKKPAGGRPAKNFEPRYGEKKKGSYQDRKRRPDAAAPGRASANKPGSKSPHHRGYRPAETDAAEPKRRWSAQEKAGRDEARGIRTHARSDRPRFDEDRPRRDERARSDRPTYSPQGGSRSFDRNDRDARGTGRPAARTERPAGDRDRGRPPYADRVDRTERRTHGDARPSYRREERPRFDRDDRGPRRESGERPRFDRDDRGPRRESGERPRFDRDDRGPRRESNDRAPYRSQDRTRSSDRSFGGRDAGRPAPRADRRDDRPRRGTDNRPGRSDWTAKPARDEQRVDVVHERLQAEALQAGDVADLTFGDLGLGENIVRVLAELGAARPFPIQAATIPAVLEGRDVLARGRTGSGKTIAFGAPLVESVLRSQAGKRREFARAPRALILAPTRELALQLDRTIQPIARSVGLFTTQIYGGVPQARQVGALRKGVDIVIGTPGRIEDLVQQGKLDLSDISIAVLDEADHMCELGFLEPVQRILRHTAEGSQKLLYSATLDREVAALVDEFLVEPAVHEVAGEDQESSTIDHRVLLIDHRDKAEILTSLVDREGKTLVFARTRAYAEMLAEQFDDAGINAVALHGDLNQAKRTRNLHRLTSGRVNVLVATDVAARGIHVDDIDLVVQADPPDEYKTYLHRSGRTGRAGRAGNVVTLITRQRRRRMTELLDRAEIEAPFDEVRLGDDLLEEISGRQAVPE